MTRFVRKAEPSRAAPALTLQQMEIIDLPRVNRLEASSYPADEAASALDLEYRAMVARELCMVAFLEGREDFVGFVAATAAPDDTRSINAYIMKNHDGYGNVLCIHSVVIEPALRRQGVGKAMLVAYLSHIKRNTSIKKVLLITKPYLIPLYETMGFRVVGESAVVHGRDKWMDMARDI